MRESVWIIFFFCGVDVKSWGSLEWGNATVLLRFRKEEFIMGIKKKEVLLLANFERGELSNFHFIEPIFTTQLV